jgi:hypothetical protein
MKKWLQPHYYMESAGAELRQLKRTSYRLLQVNILDKIVDYQTNWNEWMRADVLKDFTRIHRKVRETTVDHTKYEATILI